MRLVLLAGLLLWAPVGFGLSVIDDLGREVQLTRPAQRVVALSPHLTELVYAVGAQDRLMGVAAHSDYPPEAERLPRVGDHAGLDYERLLSLKPDLVLVWASGSGAAVMRHLERLGLNLYSSEPRELEDVAAGLERLGVLTGNVAQAQAAARDFRRRRDALEAGYAGRAPVSVFYEIWRRPLMTVNGEHLISQVLALCGGRNVFAHLSGLAPQLDVEAVLEADPEVIFAAGGDGRSLEWLDAWRRWPRLRAVRGGHLYAVDPDHMQRPTPRILLGAERVCAWLDHARVSLDLLHNQEDVPEKERPL